MRFVVSSCLREGMRLARPLYRKTDVMLAQGIVLTEQYIAGIQRCGYPGVYVDDDLSADLEVNSLISDELRAETVKSLEKVLLIAEMNENHTVKLPDIGKQMESIVDEVCRNHDVMVNMLDLSSYDNYTYSHSLNVSLISLAVGMAMGLSRKELVGLGTGTLLHDIGKVYVDKRILLKNGPLNDEEFEVIKKHPRYGYDYITSRYHFPFGHCFAILDHHEKYNGSGYPNRKKGEEISLFGRICAVADVYDALTSKRPYRDALPSYEGVEYVMGGAGSQFDPVVVDAFTRRIAPYPVGTTVKLSNGWAGLVLKNYADCSLRPKLRIYQKNGQDVPPFEISLQDDANYLNVTITGMA